MLPRKMVLAAAVISASGWAQSPVVGWIAQTAPCTSLSYGGDLALVRYPSFEGAPPRIASATTQGLDIHLATGPCTGTYSDAAAAGVIGGIDSRMFGGTAYLAGSSATTNRIFVLRVFNDGGLGPVAGGSRIVSGLSSAAPLALEANDAGLVVWLANGATATPYAILDGRIGDAGLAVAFPKRISALEADDRTGDLYALVDGAIYRRLADGRVVLQRDLSNDGIGAAAGLALYPYDAGGALLLVGQSNGNRVFVYDVAGETKGTLRGAAALGAPDGGSGRVGGIGALAVTTLADPYGRRLPFPFGTLAVQDIGGSNIKTFQWEDFAAAFTPALPVVVTPEGGVGPVMDGSTTGGDGDAGGGEAGGAPGNQAPGTGSGGRTGCGCNQGGLVGAVLAFAFIPPWRRRA